MLSGSAWAVNPGGVIVKNSYYSDASLSVRVGERDYDCQGRATYWGYQTMYHTFTAQYCPDTSGGKNDPGGDLPGPPTCTVSVAGGYPVATCG